LLHLAEKICTHCVCIFCDRQFGSIEAVRGHMLDLNHTRIGTDTDDLLDDIEDYYEYPEVSEETPGIIQEDGTMVTKTGVKIPRELAYIYKQNIANRHEGRPSMKAIGGGWERGRCLQLLGGDAGHSSTHLNSMPLYQLKRMVKRTMREEHKARYAQMRVELKRHRTCIMQHAKPQIVELYSYAK
jgi:hypothetical protein